MVCVIFYNFRLHFLKRDKIYKQINLSIKLYDCKLAPPIPKKDMRLYDDKHKVAAKEVYQPLVSSNFVESWDRGAPFFDKTWKEVGVMVYHFHGVPHRR